MISSIFYTFLAYYRATRDIIRSPKLVGLCIIPWVSGCIIWGLLFITSLFYRDTLALYLYSDTASWLSALIEGALIPAFFLFSAVIAVLVSLIICEFTTDPLVIHLLQQHTNQALPTRSTMEQLGDSVLRLIVITPLSILCFLLGLIPIIGLPFLLFSFFLVGYGLIDLPLCIRGDLWGNRLTFVLKHFFSVFLLGAIFALSFLIPGLSLFILPFGYGAAVILITFLERTHLTNH